MLPIFTAVLLIAVAHGELNVIMSEDLLSQYETKNSMDRNPPSAIVEGKNLEPGKTRIIILQATYSQKLCISSAQIDWKIELCLAKDDSWMSSLPLKSNWI